MSATAAGGSLRITKAIPNPTSSGTVLTADLVWTASVPKASEIIIPISEMWLITDCYIISTGSSAAQNTEAQLRFKKDNDRILDISELLIVTNVASQQRPNGLHSNLQYEGGSHMQVDVVVNATTNEANTIAAFAPFEKTG